MERTELLWRLFVRTGLPEVYSLYRRLAPEEREKKAADGRPAGG
ncbi:hypothetical protein [Flavonifractor hominis]|uniref:YqzL family protein n=1 Tax=Flavonifractor hominis TaxID=3133178 RepID=A0ABV1EUR1_9FIRM